MMVSKKHSGKKKSLKKRTPYPYSITHVPVRETEKLKKAKEMLRELEGL